jgi:hypothetical protein
MNERIKELREQALRWSGENVNRNLYSNYEIEQKEYEKFAELIIEDMHKKVIASILITDVVMEEKGQVPTSEDYICAINNDFGVE